ncbi:MAG: tetratricopeptide repeat protein [Muribaculaceae bacterium]|nr:tetratricopeptide repeat protein [Muribaculaceae bacterium]
MKRYIWIICAVVLAAMAGTVGVMAGKTAKDRERVRAKARYYYVEGSVALAEGKPSEAYELFKKSALTDPDYPEANYAYAIMRMTLRNDTLTSATETERSISMMKAYVDRYPSETEEAMNYSFLAARSGDLDEAIRVAERSDTLAGSLPAILIQLAQYYSARQDLDKAISTLERYERIEGNNPEISLRKFALMFMKGDTVGLINESDRLVREHPMSTEYLVIRGNAMEALEMPDSALTSYLRAEALDPEDGRVKLTLANFYLERGDSAAYDRKSSEAILSENIMLDEKLDMMTRYMRNIISDTTADSRRGARLFDGLLRQYPHEPQVLDLGAQYSATIGDYARARELMAYATDLEPENPDYWIRLAHFNFADDRYADAAAICEKAFEKLPEVPRGLLLVYGSACSLSEQYDKAREAYQRLLEMELPGALLTDDVDEMLQKAGKLPYESLVRIANIFEMVGDVSHRTGDMERCTKEYDVVLALNPDNTMALNNYAYYLAIGGGDLEKAEEMSRKAVGEQPENPTYLDTLAWILYLKGEYAEALELQEKAMETLSPDAESSGEYWDHLGDIQYMNGQKDKAVESWTKALELDEDNNSIAEKVKYQRLKGKD